jgi:polar amino acid transport system substrate-binding protein
MPARPQRLLAVLAAAVAAVCTACGQPIENTASVAGEIAPPPGLANPGHLTIAVPADLPPYASRSAGGGSSQGFDVDLGQAMAVRMGVQLSVVALDPQDLPAAARGEGVDVVLGTLVAGRNVAPPPGLALVPYLKDDSVFVVRQNSAFQPRQLDELCGHPVAFVAGTPQQALYVEAASICGPGAPTPLAARGDGEALRALRSGEADVYLADSATAAYDESQSGDLLTSGDRFGATELAMGLRTGGTPLTDAITRDFVLVRADGTYEVLLQKWGMIDRTL